MGWGNIILDYHKALYKREAEGSELAVGCMQYDDRSKWLQWSEGKTTSQEIQAEYTAWKRRGKGFSPHPSSRNAVLPAPRL